MKHHTKARRLTAVLLSLALILGTAAMPASSLQLKDDMTFGRISEYKDFYEAHSEVADLLAKGLFDLEDRIYIKDYAIPDYEASRLLTMVTHMHPELFYVSGGFSYSRYKQGDSYYVHSFIPRWGRVFYDSNGNYTGEQSYTKEQVLEMRAEFRTRAQWYLDQVDEDMSDFDKALILHDALVLNSSYLLSGETYDLMVNGQGKCYGYSEAYSYLLAQAGVNSEIVESAEMFHQWNKVEIDGKYYHVDVTWDDPTPDKPGFVKHTFFLLSDSAIEGYEANPHYDYRSDFVSDDTRFDKMRYHRINTRMCHVGGDVYVVDNNNPESSESGKHLLTYDLGADSFETVESFTDERWHADEGLVWSNNYMSLEEYDGYLYMNTENSVLVFDMQTKELSPFAVNSFEKRFYGLRVIDGRVYAVLADNPNETGTLQYVGDCYIREEPTTGEPTTEEPTTEAPTTEEPTTEAPTTEEPTTEEPTTEEPVTEPENIIGDVDGNGSIDINDATQLQRGLALFFIFDDAQRVRADANGDGAVNIKDVTALQRFLAGFENCLA